MARQTSNHEFLVIPLALIKVMRLGLWMLSGLLLMASARADTLGGDFSLTDQNGQTFQLQQWRGSVVLLFFGYTSCPDVCPAELSIMARVLTHFERQQSPVQGVFVSVDTQRDNRQKLRQYVGYFSQHLIGLSGSQARIRAVADQYGVRYRISRDDKGRIEVEHSSQLYVIDPHGRLAAIVPYGLGADHVERLVTDLMQKP